MALGMVSLLALTACQKSELVAGEALPIVVEAEVISAFGGSATLAPGLTFVGGLELSSDEPLFGAFSSFRFLADDRFLGIFDTGYWIEGTVRRDPDGRLIGLDGVSLAAMLDESGRESRKMLVDAESLALRDGEVYVGFEQRHRVVQYAPVSALHEARPSAPLALPFDTGALRNNGGLETLVVAPSESVLGPALVAISEKSVDQNGNNIAGILDGSLQGEFRVRPRDGFDITDGVFLPNGDLVLLERRFAISTGVAMRLRRIAADAIRPGAIVDGEVILEADHASQIDNMEGIDARSADDGSVRLTLVSDDNHSLLQRTLMLEFRLER